MKFSNFCLVVLGDTKGVKDEIKKVAESDVNILEAGNLIIATFSTAANVSELTDFFKLHERNFLIFEMLEGVYGTHLMDDNMNSKLFDVITKNNPEVLDSMGYDLVNDIIKSIKNKGNVSTTGYSGYSVSDATIIEETKNEELDYDSIEKHIKGLDVGDKQKLIDNILDKDPSELTEIDKKYLEILTKN